MGWVGLVEGVCELGGVEAEGAWGAFVEDAAAGGDEVKAVGPAGVGGFGAVFEGVEEGWEFYAEFADAGAGYGGSLGLVAGAAEEDVVAEVGLHLPDVGGVGFEDIDGVEVDFPFVLFREFVEGGNLPPKGRSSVAAEDEDYGFLGPEGGELERGFVGEGEEG